MTINLKGEHYEIEVEFSLIHNEKQTHEGWTVNEAYFEIDELEVKVFDPGTNEIRYDLKDQATDLVNNCSNCMEIMEKIVCDHCKM